MQQILEGFGWFSSIVRMLCFISPIFPFINAIKGKLNYEDTPIFFVSFSYLNCFCWYIYGDLAFCEQLQYCYAVGLCINTVLIVIYLAYEVKKVVVDAVLNMLILCTGTFALYRLFTVIIDDDGIIGRICIVTSFSVFGFHIYNIYKVIQEKSFAFIPIKNSLLMIISSVLWILFGIYIIDFYVTFTYLITFIISLVEIIIYNKFKKKYPVIGEKVSSSSLGVETNTTTETVQKEKIEKIEKEVENIKGEEKPVKIVDIK